MEALLVVRWLLVLAALTVVGAPLAAALFPHGERRGAPFALPVACVAVALGVFWLGQLTMGLHTVVASVVGVAVVAGIASRAGRTPNWRAVAGGYGVFAAGFLLLVAYRLADPGVTPAGGEQFLHFGLAKSLRTATSLPPEDFWFAGEPLRYYYGSQLQVSALSLATWTPMRYAFNLGIAAFYGILVVSAYGLAGAVAVARGRSYRLGGVLGVVFVAIGGATTTAIRLGFGLLPESTALAYGRPVFGAIRHLPYEEAVVQQTVPDTWSWFYTRYVVPGTLQEFPLYSFVKADLHGHALSTGYVVLAAALAWSYYRTPADERRQRSLVLFGGLGGVAGVFGFMNTWSLPTAVGLAWLAVAAADAHPATLFPDGLAARLAGPGDRDRRSRLLAEAWRLALAVVPAALVGALGVALASPFLVFGHVPTNEGVGFLPPRTDLAPFLVLYGGLLALFGAFVLQESATTLRGVDRSVLAGAGVATIVGLVVVGWPLSAPVLAVTGPVLAGAWWLVRTDRAGFEAVLLVAGVGLLLSLEFVFAKVAPWPEGPVRWNTSLKVAVQGWTLAGVAAGAVAALLLGEARVRVGGARTAASTADRARAAAPGVGLSLLVLAVFLASLPFAALTYDHQIADEVLDGEEDSLDGLAVHERHRGDQMAAIHWLDDRDEQPTVVEAPGRDEYRWTSPVSALSGTPTVVGWQGHQENYRGEAAVASRIDHVDRIYEGSWSDAVDALRGYDVRYVYVGPNEREAYGGLVSRFRGRPGLSIAFENAAVTIYRVDRDELES